MSVQLHRNPQILTDRRRIAAFEPLMTDISAKPGSGVLFDATPPAKPPDAVDRATFEVCGDFNRER
jgi:hypothetical protein